MARLGELLIAARLLTVEQIEQALRAQVVWGGRLGTNLVELALMDLDALSRALGRQHGLPAALARHFDKADPELQSRLPAELAARWATIPLLRVGPERKIAVAATDPLDDASHRAIASALAIAPSELVVSVAAELRIRYHLERVYGIARDARFLRSKGRAVTPFPEIDVPIAIDSEPELVIPIIVEPPSEPVARPPADNADDLTALIDEAIATATTPDAPEPEGRDRRSYVKTLADVGDAKETQPLGRIAIRRVAVTADRDAETFAEATRAIRRSGHRDKVAELVIETLERFAATCDAAILLVIRGDVAIGWKHFCRADSPAPELAVPLDAPGLVPAVVAHPTTARCSARELGAIDQRLLLALGKVDGDLVVVPIPIAGRVMCLLAIATESDADVASIEAVAAAAGTAFARLVRDASR